MGFLMHHHKAFEHLNSHLSLRKLQWCYVPPFLEETPIPPRVVVQSVKPPVPLLSAQSLVKMHKAFRKAAKHDLSDIMVSEDQDQVLEAHIHEDGGMWWKGLVELHTHYASKSVPIDALSLTEVQALYKDCGVADAKVDSAYLSSLFVSVNVKEANRISKETGKRPAVDNYLDIKEFLALNINTALRKFQVGESPPSPRECCRRLFAEHMLPMADDLIDPEEFRVKLQMHNDEEDVLDIKPLFALHRGKLKKIFDKFSGATMDLTTADHRCFSLFPSASHASGYVMLILHSKMILFWFRHILNCTAQHICAVLWIWTRRGCSAMLSRCTTSTPPSGGSFAPFPCHGI
jgi:hypothetical protein